jgi:hypothetical protein
MPPVVAVKYSVLMDYLELLTNIKSVDPQLGLNMLVILRTHKFDNAEQVAAFLGRMLAENALEH